MKTNNNDDKRAVSLLSLTERIFKMKKNNKIITSIIAFTTIIAVAIIMSDVTDNVKMLLFILTIPFAAGSVALLIAERRDVCCDVEVGDKYDYDDDEDIVDNNEDTELDIYVDEWVELLQLDEIDEVYAARMKRYRQIQNIHQEIHEMAMDADKRIAELCGMC